MFNQTASLAPFKETLISYEWRAGKAEGQAQDSITAGGATLQKEVNAQAWPICCLKTEPVRKELTLQRVMGTCYFPHSPQPLGLQK